VEISSQASAGSRRRTHLPASASQARPGRSQQPATCPGAAASEIAPRLLLTAWKQACGGEL
jgi:hypothetical protein